MLEGVMPQLGKEATFEALGKTWTISRRDADIWDDLYQWARARIPDPFAGLDMLAEKAGKNPALMPYFELKFAEAQEKNLSLASMNCPEILHVIDGTPEGQTEVFWRLLRIKHPEIDKTTAIEILREIGPRAQELLARADGRAEAPRGNCQALAVA